MNNKVAWVAFVTLLRKEIVRILRIWPQTILPPAITSALYFVIFGAFIGKHVGQVYGVSYAQFLVPGFVMMNAITGAYSNVSSSYFGAKFSNSIDEILIAPIPYQLIMWGYLAAGIFRGVMICFIVLFISMFFVPLHIQHIGLMLLVMVMSMTVFALAGFINGLYAKKFDDVAIIPTFVLTPLTYLGGVFYSIHSLPGFWQVVAKFNPVFYLIDAFRYAMLGKSDIKIWIAFAFVISFFVIFYLYALYMLKNNDGIRS
jgi:ABC-2 type transport system permease protein